MLVMFSSYRRNIVITQYNFGKSEQIPWRVFVLNLKPIACRFKIPTAVYNKSIIPAWIAGMVLGFVIGFNIPGDTVSLMRSLLYNRVSIVWLLYAAVFPYLLFYLLHSFSLNTPFLLVLFGRAYCYTFSLSVFSSAYGTAGWLACLLYFTTDAIICCILLLFLRKLHKLSPARLRRYAIVSVTVTALLVLFDYILIGPLRTILI